MQNRRGIFRGLMSVFCAMALALALASTALGQSSLGSVRGSVRDQTGAVIPLAKLDLVNKATNVALHAESNESGQYVFPAVLPAEYIMTVTFAGMETLQVPILVQVQASTTYDVVLKPGATETKITVSAEMTPLTITDSPALGHTLETQRIAMLPINGRDIQNLIVTVPGLELAIPGTNEVRSFGLMSGAHQYILDGAVLEESMWEESTIIRPPGIETIQEFKIENNASSAKFTRMTNIIMSSKSGTNQIHGSGFEANRDNRYGKARERTNYASVPAIAAQRVRRNRRRTGLDPQGIQREEPTFFFFAYEGFHVNQPGSGSRLRPDGRDAGRGFQRADRQPEQAYHDLRSLDDQHHDLGAPAFQLWREVERHRSRQAGPGSEVPVQHGPFYAQPGLRERQPADNSQLVRGCAKQHQGIYDHVPHRPPLRG